ncbi:MAG: hypothetical protein ACK4OE_06865 [Acidovorax sp.]|uniref:hypothetical protein n=1 Tax=Acidovorax sp. TaxID=1872122 RepID=UPI00391B6121
MLRIVAVLLMALSILPSVIYLLSALQYINSDGFGTAFFIGSAGRHFPLGLLFFEGSRLLEQELLLESQR